MGIIAPNKSNIEKPGHSTVAGESAGSSTTTATQNTLYGASAGLSITTGSNNVLIGVFSGASLKIGEANTFIGWEAGEKASGASNNNVGAGVLCLRKFVLGGSNVAIGPGAGEGLEQGSGNIYLGPSSGGEAPRNEEHQVYIGNETSTLMRGEIPLAKNEPKIAFYGKSPVAQPARPPASEASKLELSAIEKLNTTVEALRKVLFENGLTA